MTMIRRVGGALMALTLAATARTGMAGVQMELYVVPPVIEERILPGTKEIPGYRESLIRLVGCPGEYVPATFVIRPRGDLAVLPEPGALSDSGKLIPAEAVDIRVVKCWYQDPGQKYSKRIPAEWYNPMAPTGRKGLVPELLLKDPALVKVDYAKRENWVRTQVAGKEEYVKVSDPAGIFDASGKKLSFLPHFLPVRDSDKLLPVTIPAGENQQFWVTLHIPESAAAGIYDGEIRLLSGNQPIGAFKLQLRVLPFKLLPPYYISSMNHHSRLADGEFLKESMSRNERQYRAELKDLLAHGVTNPLLAPGFTPQLWEKALAIRQELGMSGQPLFYQDYKGEIQQATFSGKALDFWPENERQAVIGKALESVRERRAWLQEEVRKKIATARKYGFTDVYFYGQDEVTGDALKAEREAFKAVREAGGKVFAAGVGKAHYEAIGDLNDFFRESSYLSREYSRLWHSQGHKISSYNNPQCGVEQPLAYRRNYGLLLWQYDYDSAMDFSFYVAAFGHVWNDFDSTYWKDHNMVYPTEDGVIDTVQWEGYREAVDDVRYMTTLQRCVAAAKPSRERAEAAKFVDELKRGDVNADDADLDVLRCRMIEYILKLTADTKKEG